jgi:hypothetical protein
MKMNNFFSKEGQDIFVSLLLPQAGIFLDIGCGHPVIGNNTYALELSNWTGLLLDENCNFVNQCLSKRSSPAVCADCSNIDWIYILNKYNFPKTIDYISLDICSKNFNFLENFPFDHYEFKIMTLETDLYKRGSIIKNKSKEILCKYKQYDILLENAMLNNGDIWEDWWVNKNFINISNIIKKNMYWKNYINFLKTYKILNL